MKLAIRAATVFRAMLPRDHRTVSVKLLERHFSDPAASDFSSAGFIPIAGTYSDEMTHPFHGGYTFAFRVDEKILPASVVEKETAARVQAIERKFGRKVGKKERKEIKEQARLDLCLQAFVRTKIIRCFFLIGENLLIIGDASQAITEGILKQLTDVMGCIEAATISVFDAGNLLASRLRLQIEEPESNHFYPFSVGTACKLKTEERSYALRMADEIDEAHEAILEAIRNGAVVDELAVTFSPAGVSFRLSSDSRMKGIVFADEAVEPLNEIEDIGQHIAHESYLQSTAVAQAVMAFGGILSPI